jgi:hypothetical protein
MKNLSIYIALLFWFVGFAANAQTETQKVEMCAKKAGSDVTMLKDIVAELQAASGSEKKPTFKYSCFLQKDTRYRVTICTDDDSPGKGYVELFDKLTLLGSTYNAQTGQDFPKFEFDCSQTGVYHFFVQFIDGKAGKAVVILSLVKKL